MKSSFRVRGKGARKADGTTGDLLATVEVQVPALLDKVVLEAGGGLPRGHVVQAVAQQPVRGGCVMPGGSFGVPDPEATVYVISAPRLTASASASASRAYAASDLETSRAALRHALLQQQVMAVPSPNKLPVLRQPPARASRSWSGAAVADRRILV